MTTPTTVRIPDALKKKIHAERKKDNRNFNGQVVHILTQHYEKKGK